MGIRLQSEFRTSKDDQYRIQIIDSAFNGTPTDVMLGGDGFTLTHDGETDAVYSPIVGSSVGLTIYNDDSAVDDFRTALLNAQDKQFSLRIERWKKPESRAYVDDYRNRVLNDGGTYEAGECVNDALLALGVGTESRSNIWQQYDEDRVLADGGTYEGGNCVVDAINALGGSKTIPDEEFSVYWVGYIAQDLIEEADESKPRTIQLKATDGIGIVSTIEYEFTLAQANALSFKDVIVDILTSVEVNDLFESDETMFTSVVNWFANEHTYSTTLDPFANTKVDLKTFTTFTQDGGRLYSNALDVIREIAIIMGARFYFDNGSFRFEQISERDRLSIREFYYLNDGTANGTSEVSLDTLIDQDTAHRSGGTFRYLPAVKSVTIVRELLSSANIIGRSVVFPTDEIDVGLIPSVNNGRVILQMKSEIQTYISSVLQGTATPVFGVTIRLEPSDGSTTKYWKNTINFPTKAPIFGSGSWSTTSDTYKWAANTISRSVSQKTITQHAMSTGPLPTDGEVFIDIEFEGFFDFGFDPTFIASPNSYAYNITLQTAQYENDNDPSAVVTSEYKARNTNPRLGSNISVDLGSTRLGDGAGAIGSLYVYNGTTWVPSTGWRADNTGSYVDISKLTTTEILALQSSVVHRYEGTIIGGGGFSNRLRFDSAYWLPMRSTLMANLDQLEVEVFNIARVIDDTIADEPTDTFSDALVANVPDYNGEYINVSVGTIGGMDVDADEKTIGPFKETASGGEVEGDLNVTSNVTATDVDASGDVNATGAVTAATADIAGQLDAGDANVVDLSSRNINAKGTADIAGDATLESDLEVQGDATTQGVTTQNGALVHDITDISHSDGSNYIVAASDHMMFNTWGGGGDNGTGTITLPLATNNEGRLLRFKSDDTISVNKTAVLVPSGSDTIDGASSYTMNRPYDGIMIVAHNDRWFIVQRKEK